MANFFLRSRPTVTWATITPYALGARRLSTGTVPALGIHFEVTTAGTSDVAEPGWNTAVGGTTTDGTVTWTTRGSANTWVGATAYVVGDRVVATTAASAADQVLVHECTTGGTSGAGEPDWTNTVAGTTTDNTVTWTTRQATSWNNAHIFIARLNAAATSAPAAGDTLFIGDEHNETTAAAITIILRGTSASPLRVLCVNDTGDPASPTTPATTGQISTTGASTITFSSATDFTLDGMTIRSGSAANASSISFHNTSVTPSAFILRNCSLILNNTNDASFIALSLATLGPSRGNAEWVNVVVTFGSVVQAIQTRDINFKWSETLSAVLGTVPTLLISPQVASGTIVLESLDLSAIVTGKSVMSFVAGGHQALIRNCRIGVGGAFSAGTHPGFDGGTSTFLNVNDDNDSSVIFSRSGPGGSMFQETTVRRTGGANNGVEAFSWEVTSSSGASFHTPLVSFPIRMWNTIIGSPKTVTVEIIRDSATNLTDAQIWLEVEYLGNAAFSNSLIARDSAANSLATGVDQTASTATWVTTGLTNPNRQKLEVTITPQQVGLITARVYVALPSSTNLFIDPFITLT